ncbi:MAG: ribonuclease HII [Arenimonas sp.]|nr:ribonuclease HII [Arenimonas sp.]
MIIAGIDEAGRGPLAGPVVCAAVVLPGEHSLQGLNDSKKLSAAQRDRLFDRIRSQALAFSIVFIGPDEIDLHNILHATLLGMARALQQLPVLPDMALIDGNHVPKDLACPAQAIIKGDGKEACIMAASILAKVSRDHYMQELHRRFPEYGFDRHKGYPTPAHLQALQRHGACPEHRRSFAPVRAALARLPA